MMDAPVVFLFVSEPDWRSAAVEFYAKMLLRAPGRVRVAFDGLDSSQQEVWHVPEIRAFCAALLTHQGVAEVLARDPPGETAGMLIAAMGKARYAVDGEVYFLDIDPGGRITLNLESVCAPGAPRPDAPSTSP